MATAKKRQEERADQVDGYEHNDEGDDDDEDNEDEADDSCTAAVEEYDDAEADNSSGGGSDVMFGDDVTSSYGNIGLSVNSHHQQPGSRSTLPLSMTSSVAAEMFRRRDSDSYGTFAPLVNWRQR